MRYFDLEFLPMRYPNGEPVVSPSEEDMREFAYSHGHADGLSFEESDKCDRFFLMEDAEDCAASWGPWDYCYWSGWYGDPYPQAKGA